MCATSLIAAAAATIKENLSISRTQLSAPTKNQRKDSKLSNFYQEDFCSNDDGDRYSKQKTSH